jgi:hypothetical protein
MDFYAPRTDLAESIARQLSPDPLLGSTAGLFLASPRRTGKSTFLRLDLVPLLRERGQFPIYVDLWEDRARDPGALIAEALARAVEDLSSGAERLWKLLPFSRISVGGVTVDLPKSQATRSATLTEALVEIGARAGRDVVFIIDEAQQALASEAGRDAMFALKAARDAMNQRREGARLYLLFTGSHRDKLAALVLTTRQPFYGARVQDFPRLGRRFVDAYLRLVNPLLAKHNQLDADDVMRAFELLGHRPEKLQEVIRDHALGQGGSAGLRATVTERADLLRARVWQQHEADYGQLNPLQRAVLRRLIEDGQDFAPFSGSTIARIGADLGTAVSTSDVQKALDDLREKNIVWRPERGFYALEDQDMRDWLLAETHRQGAGGPRPPELRPPEPRPPERRPPERR